jgi:hypothetical protein
MNGINDQIKITTTEKIIAETGTSDWESLIIKE